MGFIEQIPLIGPFASYLIPFLVVLTIVVFVHEYGHYIVARWCGVHSDAFSVGFGPELFGWQDKRGTRWKVSLIPLGGYVKFRGDVDVASTTADDEALAHMSVTEREGAFPTATLPRRAAIVSAGPIANFILSTVLFAAGAMMAGLASDRPVIGEVVAESEGANAGFQAGDRLLSVDGQPISQFSDFILAVVERPGEIYQVEIGRDDETLVVPFDYSPPVVLSGITTDSAADEAGLEVDDEILSINGERLANFDVLRNIVKASGGAPLSLEVKRGEDIFSVTLSPRRTEIREPDGTIAERFLIGVRAASDLGLSSELDYPGVLGALEHGVTATGRVISGTLFFVYELFAGRGDRGDLGGPVRIAEVSGEAAEQGLSALLRLTALLSASIGLINLFPIPVLDGGHLLFYAIEAVRGKPLNARIQEIGLTIGLALVVMLMLYATYNDVSRL